MKFDIVLYFEIPVTLKIYYKSMKNLKLRFSFLNKINELKNYQKRNTLDQSKVYVFTSKPQQSYY